MDPSALQEVELAAGSPASAAASAAASPPAAAADGPALSTGGGSTPGPRCVEDPRGGGCPSKGWAPRPNRADVRGVGPHPALNPPAAAPSSSSSPPPPPLLPGGDSPTRSPG